MPTGYTAAVADGTITTLEDFVLRCARAFGALTQLRDEPFNKPIPERLEPSPYHAKQIEAARDELRQLLSLSPEEIATAAVDDYQARVLEYEKSVADFAAERARYEAMIDKVKAYNCPHTELRDFMLQQLREGFRFDCPVDRDAWCSPPGEPGTPAGWLNRAIAKVAADLTYHSEKYAEEIERTETANAWLSELRASLRAGV